MTKRAGEGAGQGRRMRRLSLHRRRRRRERRAWPARRPELTESHAAAAWCLTSEGNLPGDYCSLRAGPRPRERGWAGQPLSLGQQHQDGGLGPGLELDTCPLGCPRWHSKQHSSEKRVIAGPKDHTAGAGAQPPLHN
ncbi:hypothetical protein R6Z07F_012737 [Ovis aries]